MTQTILTLRTAHYQTATIRCVGDLPIDGCPVVVLIDGCPVVVLVVVLPVVVLLLPNNEELSQTVRRWRQPLAGTEEDEACMKHHPTR